MPVVEWVLTVEKAYRVVDLSVAIVDRISPNVVRMKAVTMGFAFLLLVSVD